MRRQGRGGGGGGGISRFARDGGGLKIVGKVPKFLLDIEAQHPGVLGKTAVGSLPGGQQQHVGGTHENTQDLDAAAGADDCSGDDPVEQEAFQRALVEQGLDENGNPLPKKQDGTQPPPAKRRPAAAAAAAAPQAPVAPKLVAGAANTKLKSLSTSRQHTAGKDAPKVNRSLLSFSVDDDSDSEDDEDS